MKQRHAVELPRPGALPQVASGLTRYRNLFAEIAQAARLWQVFAFVELALIGLLLAGYLYLVSTGRVSVWIVEVDRLGRAHTFGPAERLHLSDRENVTRHQLTLLVRNLRTVSTDPVAQRQMLFEAFGYVAGDARFDA